MELFVSANCICINKLQNCQPESKQSSKAAHQRNDINSLLGNTGIGHGKGIGYDLILFSRTPLSLQDQEKPRPRPMNQQAHESRSRRGSRPFEEDRRSGNGLPSNSATIHYGLKSAADYRSLLDAGGYGWLVVLERRDRKLELLLERTAPARAESRHVPMSSGRHSSGDHMPLASPRARCSTSPAWSASHGSLDR